MPVCKKPFRNFGCGQCIPCLITKRRIWTHRIVLESLMHASNSFLTLTYDEVNHPVGGTLVPRDFVLFMKRLRKHYPAGAVRFYGVGEYGDQTQRPHYHAALFGVGPTETQVVADSWGLGHSMLGDLTPASARYIAGYVTKKMTRSDDPRLDGRAPEFALMSRRPGIGFSAVPTLSKMLDSKHGLTEIDRVGDVPASLTHGKSQLPLGRYLREKLRSDLGMISRSDSLQPVQWMDDRDRKIAEEQSLQMSALWLNYCSSPQASQKPFHLYLQEMKSQKILNLETRFNNRNRKSL